jgi:UDP-2,3-diacylglucosamine pyrophosphatase LpxH
MNLVFMRNKIIKRIILPAVLILIIILFTGCTGWLRVFNSYDSTNQEKKVNSETTTEIETTANEDTLSSEKNSLKDGENNNINTENSIITADNILFTFIAAGDNRPANDILPQPEVFIDLLGYIEKSNPSFFVSTGDIINGNTDNQEIIKRQFLDYLNAAEVLSCINFIAPGNHDVANNTSKKYFLELINKQVFRQSELQDIQILEVESTKADTIEGNDSNQVDNISFYYCFEFKDTYFVVLNGYEKGYWGTIKAEQLLWLEKLLEILIDKKVFIFIHPPVYSFLNPDCITDGSIHVAFSSKKNQDYIRELFKKFKVDGVFSGHEHMYNKHDHDGTEYIITGCSGAYPYTSEDEGGFYHFLKIEVKSDSWILNVINRDGNLYYKEEISFN